LRLPEVANAGSGQGFCGYGNGHRRSPVATLKAAPASKGVARQ